MVRNQYSLGIMIILIGIVILLGKFGVFSFLGALFWPVFVLAPGLLFHFLFFGRVLPSGVLIPGGILTTYSLMFFFCNIFGWQAMAYIWPGFILGVAVGLYEFYLFDRHQPRGALIASIILTVIAAVFFGFTLLFSGGVYFVAIGLILLGVLLIFRNKQSW
jgi:hypothetical protein